MSAKAAEGCVKPAWAINKMRKWSACVLSESGTLGYAESTNL